MQAVTFYPFAAQGMNYPPPQLPQLPFHSKNTLCSATNGTDQSAFLCNNKFFSQSRYALIEALQHSGIKKNDIVLLPAFHCRSMVDPILHVGAKALFYPVTSELYPDFLAIQSLLEGKQASVMLLTHYFGFPNAIIECKQFCEKYKITLIEDCAHAMYGSHQGKLLGTIGDYAVSSAWKFLPIRDGAFLRCNTKEHKYIPKTPSLIEEIKSIQYLLQHKKKWHNSPIPQPANKIALMAQAKQLMLQKTTIDSSNKPELITQKQGLSGLKTSHWIIQHANHMHVIEQRRNNYLRWLEGISNMSNVYPLYPTLPEHVVPYAFPLVTDNEGLAFHLLKLAGIPLWRWENMSITTCNTAQQYRISLLQLPCHQEIQPTILNWMIKTTRDLLSN